MHKNTLPVVLRIAPKAKAGPIIPIEPYRDFECKEIFNPFFETCYFVIFL
jgi:hypothetical protein